MIKKNQRSTAARKYTGVKCAKYSGVEENGDNELKVRYLSKYT